MKKVLVAACLLITSHGFGLAQSTITIGDTNIEAAADGDKRSLLLAQQVALSQTATIHRLSFYVTAAHGELRLGIYDASGPGGDPMQARRGYRIGANPTTQGVGERDDGPHSNKPTRRNAW